MTKYVPVRILVHGRRHCTAMLNEPLEATAIVIQGDTLKHQMFSSSTPLRHKALLLRCIGFPGHWHTTLGRLWYRMVLQEDFGDTS
jgi:hypothetical protein